jgi:hypothetical protein
MNSGVLHNVDVEFYARCYKAGYCLQLDSNWQPSLIGHCGRCGRVNKPA